MSEERMTSHIKSMVTNGYMSDKQRELQEKLINLSKESGLSVGEVIATFEATKATILNDTLL